MHFNIQVGRTFMTHSIPEVNSPFIHPPALSDYFWLSATSNFGNGLASINVFDCLLERPQLIGRKNHLPGVFIV
jgi:hypothetical protein